MAIRFFNTRSRSIETFVPRDTATRRVGLYCCGPTVYDLAHIGNFRTFVFADLLRRYLEFRGFQVEHVMNVTDVEDKIIARIQASGRSLAEYTGQYEQAFFDDLRLLGCQPPHQTPHATAYLAEMIALIQRLLDRGMAYQASDGSVYFSIDQYRRSGACYGQLVKLDFEGQRPGERIRQDEYAKEAVADFALWKARTAEDGAVFWPSPWGEGRPGWHIECSAMSMKLLGPNFDLHLGGEDLMFPHHEDEIAQSEAAGLGAPGSPFVNYWLHVAHLLVEGRKMSKSLGNYYTLRDILNRGFSGREIRSALLTTHYREPFNFTFEGLRAARAALQRLDDCLDKLRTVAGDVVAEPDAVLLDKFTQAMDEDMNVSAAWAVLFDWVRQCNRAAAEGQLSPAAAAAAWAAWQRLDGTLAVGLSEPASQAPAEVQALLSERQAARQARDFPQADRLRQTIKERGWLVEDTPQGPKLKRA